jgi:hypothetical protein
MFERDEPMMFPGTISELPALTDKTDEMSSGNEVPTETITTPTTNEDNPKRYPSVSAAPVKNLADAMSKPTDTTKMANAIINSMLT